MKRGLLLLAALGAASVLGGPSAGGRRPAGDPVEVVVALKRPALASAFSIRSSAAHRYLGTLAAGQAEVERRIETAIPSARVRWRYRYVLDALAVVVPSSDVRRLAALPGVASVYPSVRYRSQLDTTPGLIGAPQLWGPNLETAGEGMKIGIIDDGVEQTHQFFNPSGFSYPPGFPKGQTAYTTPKVIVARAFAPPSPHWRYASRPFDPQWSDHGTHVAGIAAGDHGTPAPGARAAGLSGIAPKAYIGNYKVLTIPTPGVGLDGNSPEIAAGIEAAVRDGMNVINLSLGEPEVEPSRDLVVEAIDGAADAGVVPVVAAGNDFLDLGFGTIISPATAPKAIAAAATTKSGSVADFSSGGPTPVSLELKPDVSAPGVDVYSSVPGGWDSFSGTSMATPHVAGGAALLLERHPNWTVAQVKSALVLTGTPMESPSGIGEAPPTREGGGQIDLPAADDPRVFASPTNISFGLLRRGRVLTRTIQLTDAGGGAGTWQVRVTRRGGVNVKIDAPQTATVPGSLSVRVAPGLLARPGDVSGFVLLSRAGIVRRIPFWLHVEVPALGRERHILLRHGGVYRGDTRRKPALVDSYRYPTDPSGLGIASRLSGPEQVFRLVLRRPVANFGVVILSQSGGAHVTPRVVHAGDENRLTGYAALPLDLNPYRSTVDHLVPVAGAVLPAPGAYDIVFDSRSNATAGSFTFRLWIDDTRPPSVHLITRTVTPGAPLRLAVTDAGSGVDPQSLTVRVDGSRRSVSYAAGRASVSLPRLRRGNHTFVVSVSDFQESKNMEDVARILPNTRVLRTTFRIR
ncbi:MAG: S8 family serine peptidase [Gaiellaceae bacterium]